MNGEVPYKQGEFCWNELGTRDVNAAIRFYQELIGWDVSSHDMGEHGSYHIFQVEGRDVGAGYQMCGPHFEGMLPHWASYVWVDDVDAVAAQAVASGGGVVQPPMDVPNVGRMAFLKDPQGASFAIFKGREHKGAARLDWKPGKFCWNELMTTDAVAARKFYCDLLGWTFSEISSSPDSVYTVFQMGEQSVAGMMEMKAPQFQGVPPHWFPYILVADCDMVAAKAQELGAQTIVPPTDIPNTGRFAVINDPSGAQFGILKPLPM